MPDGTEFQADQTQELFEEYSKRFRLRHGLERPEVGALVQYGAPEFALQRLEQAAEAGMEPPEPKKEPSGLFGWFDRNVGRKVGYAVTQMIPAWSEFVISQPWASGFMKWQLGEEGYKTWQRSKALEGMSLGDEIRKHGFAEGMNRNIRRLAKAREERPGMFWGEKLIGEIVLDPTTYMGWGLVSRVPLLGKWGGGFVMDAIPRAMWRNTMGKGAKYIRKGTLPWLFAASPQTVIKNEARPVKNALRRLFGSKAITTGDKTATKRLVEFMDALKKSGGPPDDRFMQEISEAMGHAIEPDDITTLLNAGRAMEDVASTVGNAFVPGEVVGTWWSRVATMAPEDAMKFMANTVEESKRLWFDSQLLARKESTHWIQRQIAKKQDWMSNWLQGRTNRWVMTEPARAILVFANYGLFNVLEDYVRIYGGGFKAHRQAQNTFKLMYAGVPNVPEELMEAGMRGYAEYAKWAQSLGIPKAAKVPWLAGGGVPVVKDIVGVLQRVNVHMTDFSTGLRRGLYGDAYESSMLKGAKKFGYADRYQYGKAMDLNSLVPQLGDTQMAKEARGIARVMVLNGDFEGLRALSSTIYNDVAANLGAAGDILTKNAKDLHFTVRDRILNQVREKGPGWLATPEGIAAAKTELRLMQAERLHFTPKYIDYAIGQRMSGLKRLVTIDPDDDAVFSLGNESLQWLQDMNHLAAELNSAAVNLSDESTAKAINANRAAYRELQETIQRRTLELEEIIGGAQDRVGASKIRTPVQAREMAGYLGKLKKQLKQHRDTYAEGTVKINQLDDEFFSKVAVEHKGGPVGHFWDQVKDELKVGNMRSITDPMDKRLPAKLKIVLSRPKAARVTTEMGDRGLVPTRVPGYGWKHPDIPATYNEFRDAFYKSYKEVKSEWATGQIDKFMGRPKLGPGGRVTRAKGLSSMAIDDLQEFMSTRRWPVEEVPLAKAASKTVAKAEALAKEASERQMRQAEAAVSQKADVWMMLEDQIDTAVDDVSTMLRKGAIDPGDRSALDSYFGRLADQVETMMSDDVVASGVRQNVKESSENALNATKDIFTNYDNEMMFEVGAKMFNPFWTYQFRSWFWMIGQAMQHPGAALAMGPQGKFWQHTEDGYLPVPMLGVQFSPIRGTALGRLRRAFRGPRPPRYSGMLGTVDEWKQEYLERIGFWPGLHVTVPLEMMAGLFSEGSRQEMTSVLVESLPSAPATLLEGFVAASRVAGPGVTNALAEEFFPSPFRAYYMAKQLWDDHQVTVSKAQEMGHDDWIADAYSKVAIFQMAEQQVSLMRFNPPGWQTLVDKVTKMNTELTGLTEEEQKEIRRKGLRLSEVAPLSRVDRAKLQQIEGFEALAEASRPLSEGMRQVYLETQSDKYDMIDEARQSLLSEQAQDDWRLESGWVSPKEWRNNYYERWRELRAGITMMIESEYYGQTGRTLEEQHWIRERLGFSPEVLHPVDIVLDAIFSMEPVVDPLSGEADWVGMFEAQEQVLAMLPKDTQMEVREYINRNATPLMTKFREGREIMRNYWDTEKRIPEYYRSIGQPQAAKELETLFVQVKRDEQEMWSAINQGMPVDVAKMLARRPYAERLARHIAEWRWHLANNPRHPFYDLRIKDYLKMFYGREG